MSIQSRLASTLRSAADAVENNNTGDKVRQWVYDTRVKTAGLIKPSTPKCHLNLQVLKGGSEVSGS